MLRTRISKKYRYRYRLRKKRSVFSLKFCLCNYNCNREIIVNKLQYWLSRLAPGPGECQRPTTRSSSGRGWGWRSAARWGRPASSAWRQLDHSARRRSAGSARLQRYVRTVTYSQCEQQVSPLGGSRLYGVRSTYISGLEKSL